MLLGAELWYLLFHLFPVPHLRAYHNFRCSNFSFRLAGAGSSFCQDPAFFRLKEWSNQVSFVLASRVGFEHLQVLG